VFYGGSMLFRLLPIRSLHFRRAIRKREQDLQLSTREQRRFNPRGNRIKFGMGAGLDADGLAFEDKMALNQSAPEVECLARVLQVLWCRCGSIGSFEFKGNPAKVQAVRVLSQPVK